MRLDSARHHQVPSDSEGYSEHRLNDALPVGRDVRYPQLRRELMRRYPKHSWPESQKVRNSIQLHGKRGTLAVLTIL
jgi:hypothetical protein